MVFNIKSPVIKAFIDTLYNNNPQCLRPFL